MVHQENASRLVKRHVFRIYLMVSLIISSFEIGLYMLPLKCKIQLLYKIPRYYIYLRAILVNVYNLYHIIEIIYFN